MTGENEHISPAFRTLETLLVDKGRSITYAAHRIQDGKLQQVKLSTQPLKGSAEPPHSIVELFVALSSSLGYPYATAALIKDVIAHQGTNTRQPSCSVSAGPTVRYLPAGNGSGG